MNKLTLPYTKEEFRDARNWLQRETTEEGDKPFGDITRRALGIVLTALPSLESDSALLDAGCILLNTCGESVIYTKRDLRSAISIALDYLPEGSQARASTRARFNTIREWVAQNGGVSLHYSVSDDLMEMLQESFGQQITPA